MVLDNTPQIGALRSFFLAFGAREIAIFEFFVPYNIDRRLINRFSGVIVKYWMQLSFLTSASKYKRKPDIGFIFFTSPDV